MRRGGRFLLFTILEGAGLFSLSAQEISGGKELEEDFSLSMFTLRDLFLQQDDGGLNLQGLLNVAALTVIGILVVLGIAALVLHIIRRKKNASYEKDFRLTKDTVIKTKLDTISEEEFTKILDGGLKLSKKIDTHTGRKNSMVLPVLVYKISLQMGVDKKTAAKYFCASLFYDSGFIDVPSELFFGEILTSKEKKQFRKHVLSFEEYIEHLPRELYTECYNACSFHHENYNGTGYPEGLDGKDIPPVAKILRVVESYLSLISKGTYHKGLSKKKAIKDLRGRGEIYDQTIIDILESLV